MVQRLSIAKLDVAVAFKNVRVTPHQAWDFFMWCTTSWYHIFKSPLIRRTASPSCWGLMAAAAKHTHCNTTINITNILPERNAVMSHVKIVKSWETESPTQIPTGARAIVSRRGGVHKLLSTSLYADACSMAGVQPNASDQTALITSASLASDNVGLFEPVGKGETPVLTPRKIIIRIDEWMLSVSPSTLTPCESPSLRQG